MDSVQVDQLQEIQRIKDIPPNKRDRNDVLKYEDIVSSINGYGRLVHYKLYGNSMEFSAENCAILKVQEGKFKQGLIHGYGREFDANSPNGFVHIGYFKDGQPFVGRFEKFDMDEV